MTETMNEPPQALCGVNFFVGSSPWLFFCVIPTTRPSSILLLLVLAPFVTYVINVLNVL